MSKKTTQHRNTLTLGLILVPLFLMLFAFCAPGLSSAQERPTLKASVEIESGWLKTSYPERFVTQRARALNKVVAVELNPTERFGLMFRMDVDGKITQPTFDDLQGKVIKRYDEYEGRDGVMEGLIRFQVSHALELEALAGYSKMKYEESYSTGQDVGLPPVHTEIVREIEGVMAGIGSWHEWEKASITARFIAYPFLNKKSHSTQTYQGLVISPDIADEDGWGLDFRAGFEYNLWENIGVNATYQWRQIKTNRLSGVSANSAVKIAETIRGHYVAIGMGVRF